jgi:hypothetical protein
VYCRVKVFTVMISIIHIWDIWAWISA